MAARRPATPPTDASVTRYQAARLLGVAERTIDRMLERGELTGEKDDRGVYSISLAHVQALIADRPPVPDAERGSSDDSIGLIHHATALSKSANEALMWLINKQQDVIGALSSELGTVQQSYSAAIRAEAAQRLETELALRAEGRKDKALEEVIPFAERILSQSVRSKAGSKVLDSLARLGDEQWETVRGMATELLDMAPADVAQLDALRKERKKEGTDGSDNPETDSESTAGRRDE